jgi:hypothetical protein
MYSGKIAVPPGGGGIVIVTAKMNEFPKRSKASISKQKKQLILKAFNKIKKEITHGDKGNVNT